MTEPYYGPIAPEKDIFIERTFVAGDLVTGIGYGIQLVLYCTCVGYLWGQKKNRNRTSIFLIAYMTFLLLIETVYVAVQARTVQDMYIDNRNYPGGPWEYFLATQDKAINVIFYATLFLLTFLSDFLVLWRCWVIWRASGTYGAYLAVAFPIMMLIASFVMGTLWTLQSSQPGLSLYSELPMAYGISYFWVSLWVNIVMTALITGRLAWYRRTAMKSLPEDHVREYYSLITIVVESASLYSVFALIFIITYMIEHPINQIGLSVASSSQQIAGYWIIYRIAKGKAWTQHTLKNAGSAENTSVHFASQLASQRGVTSIPVFAVTTAHTHSTDLESGHQASTINTEKRRHEKDHQNLS